MWLFPCVPSSLIIQEKQLPLSTSQILSGKNQHLINTYILYIMYYCYILHIISVALLKYVGDHMYIYLSVVGYTHYPSLSALLLSKIIKKRIHVQIMILCPLGAL